MLTVVGATWTDRVETVYNFGVDKFHTYFVGESGAWVHNCKEADEAVAELQRTNPELFRLGRCKQCAPKLAEAFRAKGLSGEVVEVQTVKGGIWHDDHGLISEDGIHQGVRVGDKVYDNLTPDGASVSEWGAKLGLGEQPGMRVLTIEEF